MASAGKQVQLHKDSPSCQLRIQQKKPMPAPNKAPTTKWIQNLSQS
jgi:hypothetical protein